tara:strand:- start:84 stop:287 length:204 start_codon:yes stop_codon:yes gene_type:complete
MNLKPELVEKKEPPIIIKIKKIKEYSLVVFSKEKPIFETLLEIAKNSSLKFIDLSAKNKKRINIKNK